jgi:hypothetical protein
MAAMAFSTPGIVYVPAFVASPVIGSWDIVLPPAETVRPVRPVHPRVARFRLGFVASFAAVAEVEV